ncbi:hypothetical protein K439DRAFT_1164069 [Ramaria rubella]|nr:hypothetical protein K439DRAFT_1164069 [Ramaria rubella]
MLAFHFLPFFVFLNPSPDSSSTQHSSGRGGVGNIRRASAPSTSPSPFHAPGPDDFSPTRGRELPRSLTSTAITGKPTYSGRGGAGNIRSPSRERSTGYAAAAEEHNALVHAAEHNAELPHSSGRGGFGNILGSPTRSRSRSTSVDAGVHSSGRGGAGNMVLGAGVEQTIVEDERERREHHVKEGVHSTGRGGAANVTTAPSPGIDAVPFHTPQPPIHSSGRGGAGNIHEATRQRSRSRGPSRDVNGRDVGTDGDTGLRGRTDRRGSFSGLWDRVRSGERTE